MNEIIIFSDGVEWKAWFKGPHAERIRSLFGTDVLPTSYTARADSEVVLNRVRHLNPGVVVHLAELVSA